MNRGRLFLVDWDPQSAAERSKTLTADGWSVESESSDGARALKHVRDNLPDVIAIDLSRQASNGRETARAVRASKDLRSIPIVFFGGSEEARAKAIAAVPGAAVADASELTAVLARTTIRTV